MCTLRERLRRARFNTDIDWDDLRLFDDAGYYVVVVGLGDFAAVEGAWD